MHSSTTRADRRPSRAPPGFENPPQATRTTASSRERPTAKLTVWRPSRRRYERELLYGLRCRLRQDGGMTKVRPAVSDGPARWLTHSDVDWWDLVRYGPPGFDVYVRIALAHDADRADAEGEEPALREALATLARYTTTPARGFAAIWEGWAGERPATKAPRVVIPHRTMPRTSHRRSANTGATNEATTLC